MQLPDEYKVWQSISQIEVCSGASNKTLLRYEKAGISTVVHNKVKYFNTREVFNKMKDGKRAIYISRLNNEYKGKWEGQGYDQQPVADADADDCCTNVDTASSSNTEESIYYFNGSGSNSLMKFFTKNAGKSFTNLIVYPNTTPLSEVIESVINKVEEDVVLSLYVEDVAEVTDHTFLFYLKKKGIDMIKIIIDS